MNRSSGWALGGHWISRDAFKLFVCGAAILFWELVLIRWLGNSVRIVAYYSNFILLSSFLGLGAGALLTPKKINLEPWIFPCLSLCLILGPALSGINHGNPKSADEYVWLSSTTPDVLLPFWVILLLVFSINTLVFLIFGQMVGRLFGKFPPLKAYSIEIGGSLLGIALFGLASFSRLPPTLWFFMGFVMVLVMIESSKKIFAIALVCCISVFLIGNAYQKDFFWSPYYKIHLTPHTMIKELKTKQTVFVPKSSIYKLSVNNDYHQLILNLHDRPKEKEHAFFQSWRNMYDLPYQENDQVPEGPVLIVGAGTGNDVSAALRNTTSAIDIVEIDPEILKIGRALHQEKPYSNERVRIINNDARSHFTRTKQRYALVIFGLLDSHTLLSSYSSLRLDNFVYTRQSMEKVKELLLPGGKVYLTFATNREWIHHRFINLLNSVFDFETRALNDPQGDYANGLVYVNGKSRNQTSPPTGISYPGVKIPTDDWPFLYLKGPNLPGHYQIFMGLVLLLSGLSLRLLPKGERKLKLNYFFMGAAFFLIETTNIIKLSILYGSTWIVNILVFAGILVLVLLGNLTSKFVREKWMFPMFALLFASLLLAYNVSPDNLLGIASPLLQGVMAVIVYMGAIFFASLIFAKWIQKEEKLYAAYGSNLLGAMVGGISEYLSLMLGFQFLIPVAAGYYLFAYFTHRRLTAPAVCMGIECTFDPFETLST